MKLKKKPNKKHEKYLKENRISNRRAKKGEVKIVEDDNLNDIDDVGIEELPKVEQNIIKVTKKTKERMVKNRNKQIKKGHFERFKRENGIDDDIEARRKLHGKHQKAALLEKAKRKESLTSKNLIRLKNSPRKTKDGNFPSLFDFGLDYTEARFVSEWVRTNDELAAARKANIVKTTTPMSKAEQIIDDLINKPNVAQAMRAAIDDQIQRNLLTSDKILSQISKIAFADPNEMFEPDGSGTLRQMEDIPPYLRSCIKQIEHRTVYEGRGANRRNTGYITKIKLHDGLTALKTLLKEVEGKLDSKNKLQFNQYNFGPVQNNMQLDDVLEKLSDEEINLLMKIANMGNDNEEEEEVIDASIDGVEPLYSNKELREIEKCNFDD